MIFYVCAAACVDADAERRCYVATPLQFYAIFTVVY